jgi:putative ABC transport system permease protein
MLKHNLLIIYRSFKKSKSTFIINVIGLSTALACSLLIYLWVTDELKFDKFHEKDARLFQVFENQKLEDGIKTTDATSGSLADALAADIPEVEYAITVTPTSWFPKVTLSHDDKVIKATGQFVGANFFNVFSYKLITGNKDQVLADKKSMVISKDLAEKLFGSNDNCVGKTITWKWQNLSEQYQISGVYKETANASTQFDFVLPFAWLKEKFTSITEWGNYGPNTFITLKNGSNVSQVNAKIVNFMSDKITDSNRSLFLKRYSETYLHGRYENGVAVGGRIEYVKLFSIIAIFILIIACVNFMNLSTAKASRKLKEVGLKKTFGASRMSLILQFYAEAMIISFLSLIIAIILIILLLPQFNNLTGKNIALNLNANLIFTFIGVAVITGLIAGSYPAIYLSGFKPAAVLKGMVKSSISELWIRKGLVVFQFGISVILIVCVFVTYKQIEFIQTQNIGYNKDNIITFEKEGKIAENPEAFIAGLKNIPGVVDASGIAQNIIGSAQANTMGLEWPGKQPNQLVQFFNVGVYYDFIETLGMKMKAGRSFSKNFGAEDSKIIFNETAVKTMELTDPVGKVVKLFGKDMQIIGVVKNFHNESLHEALKPLFLVLAPQNIMEIVVKMKGGQERETIQKLQSYYESYNPGFIFDFKFMDEDYQAQYVSEKRVAVLSRYFAGLTILISCLGLFGLAAFTAERRFKEIGIRKTIGSSDFNIIYLLSKDFTIMAIVAILIALPVSYLLTRGWLNDFQYRIDLKLWYFVSAGLLALCITWVTVGIQALKATKINLVECLRVSN